MEGVGHEKGREEERPQQHEVTTKKRLWEREKVAGWPWMLQSAKQAELELELELERWSESAG
jgi:hypothetical protein